ncbi:transcriptional protein SWT1 isoform X2 [Lethenteron reissneri]|uniref:transcriptional protein SWT1 isoform X2 n=1 Tax=Lethenteron reissneri TaxID=7753 RepID=UPI002AB7BC3A|nr:transcriptional protein SWT1 isoform X2 [Lethenteron reissneri]
MTVTSSRVEKLMCMAETSSRGRREAISLDLDFGMETRKLGSDSSETFPPNGTENLRKSRKRKARDDDDDNREDGDGELAMPGTSWHGPWTSSRANFKPSIPAKPDRRQQKPTDEPPVKRRAVGKPTASATMTRPTSASLAVSAKKGEKLTAPGSPGRVLTRAAVAELLERRSEHVRRFEASASERGSAVRPAEPRGVARRDSQGSSRDGQGKAEKAAIPRATGGERTGLALKCKSARVASRSKLGENVQSSGRGSGKKEGAVPSAVKPSIHAELERDDGGSAVGEGSGKGLSFSCNRVRPLGAEGRRPGARPATMGRAKPAAARQGAPEAECRLKVPAKKRAPSVASKRPKVQLKIGPGRPAMVPGAGREEQDRLTAKNNAELRARGEEEEERAIPELAINAVRVKERGGRNVGESVVERVRPNVAVVPPKARLAVQPDWEMSAIVETETTVYGHDDPPRSASLAVVGDEGGGGQPCRMEVDLPPPSFAGGGTAEPCRLHVVLDTNVLLQELPLVRRLREWRVPGLGAPTLLVPWAVLQELGSLKGGRRRAARGATASAGEEEAADGGTAGMVERATSYLNDCLARRLPRLRGQSVQEASQRPCGLLEESNNDGVLQCSLQCKQQHPSARTLLLTDDVNLCSKALVSGLNACTVRNLAAELGRIADEEAGAPAPPRRVAPSSPECQLAAGMDRSRARAGDRTAVSTRGQGPAGHGQKDAGYQLTQRIHRLLHTDFKDALAAIVEEEMKLAYDDKWLDVVCMPPPYTLAHALHCLNKHWSAVFGSVVRRGLQQTVMALQKQQHRRVWGRKDVADARWAPASLDGALTILREFGKRSEYGGSVPRAYAALMPLKRLGNQVVEAVGGDEVAGDEVAADDDDDAAAAEEEEAASTRSAPRAAEGPAVVDAGAPGAAAGPASGDPWEVLEDVWRAVDQSRELICGHAGRLTVSAEVSSVARPDWAFLQELVPAVRTLASSVGAVLESNCSEHSITQLCNVLQGFVNCQVLRLRQCTLTPQSLFQCLFGPQQREKLEIGCAQLVEAAAMLEGARLSLMPHALLAGWS